MLFRSHWHDCTHGFAVRGDPSIPAVKEGKEGSFKASVKFFLKYYLSARALCLLCSCQWRRNSYTSGSLDILSRCGVIFPPKANVHKRSTCSPIARGYAHVYGVVGCIVMILSAGWCTPSAPDTSFPCRSFSSRLYSCRFQNYPACRWESSCSGLRYLHKA